MKHKHIITHYRNGCQWANGEIQLADTDQTSDWGMVTCRLCLRSRSRTQQRNHLREISLNRINTMK